MIKSGKHFYIEYFVISNWGFRNMAGQPQQRRYLRPPGWRYKPIKLRCRQVMAIHDADYRLMIAPCTKRRYSSWPYAWDALLRHVDKYPDFEWWLEEDLVRCRDTGRKWSQVCKECLQWGVAPPAQGDRALPRCRRCGREAQPVDEPIRTPPRRAEARSPALATPLAPIPRKHNDTPLIPQSHRPPTPDPQDIVR